MKKILSLLIVMLLFFSIPVFAEEDDPGITPDSFLWGLDKALDQLTLLLTFNEGKKAKKGLEIARERLLEVKVMVEENKLKAAGKAKDAHGKTLVKVKKNIEEIEEEDATEEIKEVIEIEKELEDHDEEIEQTFGKLKIKIEIKGEATQEQKDLIDSILNSLKGHTGDLEIKIKIKKDKTKIKIKQKTGKSEEEIEVEIEEIEKENGIKKKDKAFEAIEDAEEEIKELKEEIKEVDVTTEVLKFTEVLKLLENAESKLENAIKAFDEEKFGEAYGQANAAEKLAKNALRKLEGKEEDIENKIKVKLEG